MTPVHYRGGAPALQDLIGGHVSASINPISESMDVRQGGNDPDLAVTGSQRSSFLPEVPTMREAGYNVVGGILASAYSCRRRRPRRS
jgi:tripartite-type tricarboxylate transporter receptor subunit TctC